MSDNEYERFEITDYDLDNEFNPNRIRKRQTKHHQIYGIWADDSDNDDNENSSGRRRGGRKGRLGLGSSCSRSKDYSAPVSFVAGGIQQSGKNKNEENDSNNDEDDENPITDEEEEINSRPGFSTGGRSTLMDVDPAHTSDDSDEEAVAEKSQQTQQRPSYSRQNQASSSNVGAWEQHTRGIGAKLLLQMGYKPGKGLGKDLQGISQPVEAHVRKGRGAIGAYGPETATSVGSKEKVPQIDNVCDTKEFKEDFNNWKKAGDTKQDKAPKRYNYRTVEEVLEKGKNSNCIIGDKISKSLGNVPVIDMTGPEKRVLSGYHAIGQTKVVDEDLYDLNEQPKKTTSFELPELLDNLIFILNMCEQDIISLDSAQLAVIQRQLALGEEKKNIDEILKLESELIATLDKVLLLVNELTNRDCDLTLERAEYIFLEMQQNYVSEYKYFRLGDLAASIIAPLLKNHLCDWKPLENPTMHVDLIKKWRTILEKRNDASTETRHNVFDPYSALVWAGLVPSFRSCAEFWDPKHHQNMAALLDCWAPLFPTWILDSVLEQLILPRLSTAVRNWDPLTDTVPIHIWILPWNSILGHKMEEFIFPTIREKLGNALQAWMPQDRSARAMLTPWKGAFDDSEMQDFLLQHIIPKLQMVLSEFVVNPLQQDLEPWNQVWEWHELIPSMQMAQLLDKYFFPKWMQVLVLWLNQSPDYGEISRWYSGWKSMLSDEILREPNIKEHLRRALEIMHRATDQTASPLIAGSTVGPNITATPVPPPPQPPPPPSLIDLQLSTAAQIDFKELVSRKCAERGVLFAPLPGRRELGKQIYRVGKLYCYIDRNVCMLSDGTFKNWMPTPLQPMIERAVTGLLN